MDHIIVSSITLHQYLSIEGSKKFLSLLEVGFSATQTLAFFDKLQILNYPLNFDMESIFSYTLGRIYLVLRVFQSPDKNSECVPSISKDILNLILKFILLA